MIEERKHALLSASGAKRWMACPPSARLEDSFPEEQTSDFAEEGTFAHAYAELLLKNNLNMLPKKVFDKEQKELQKSKYYSQALEDYIQSYVSIIMEHSSEAKSKCNDSMILLEQKVDYSLWVPEGFGTSDVLIISDGAMEVIDLKYGKGVSVSAEDNPQMRLYALGALNVFSDLYDINTVKMTIIQPRLDSISTDSIEVVDLINWAEFELAEKARLAYAGEGEFQAGEHCKFCKAKATCRARADENLQLAKYEFAVPALLAESEISEILKKVEQLQAWASDVKDYAYEQATKHGKKWTGWKLVEGRSNRMYRDKDEVAAKLKEEGYAECTIYEKSLYGVTAMEKVLGKKLFEDYLKDLIIKPAGKPVLVLESDKRQEINGLQSAVSDFSEDILS